jgi:hypothetical protein
MTLKHRNRNFAEACRLIDAGEPLSRVVSYFETRQEAVEQFAKRQASNHQINGAKQGCCCCGAADGDLRLTRLDWKAYVTPATYLGDLVTMLIHGIWRVPYGPFLPIPTMERVTFATHHNVCESCMRGLRQQKRFALLLEVVATFMLFLGVLAVPAMLLDVFWMVPRSHRPNHMPYLWLAIVILGIGAVLSAFVHPIRTPKALKSIGCRPFRLVGIKTFL